MMFLLDLRERLSSRVQLTTDGHKAYLEGMFRAFGDDVDYAMLVKLFGPSSEGEKRYSPPECVGARRQSLFLALQLGSPAQEPRRHFSGDGCWTIRHASEHV